MRSVQGTSVTGFPDYGRSELKIARTETSHQQLKRQSQCSFLANTWDKLTTIRDVDSKSLCELYV